MPGEGPAEPALLEEGEGEAEAAPRRLPPVALRGAEGGREGSGRRCCCCSEPTPDFASGSKFHSGAA